MANVELYVFFKIELGCIISDLLNISFVVKVEIYGSSNLWATYRHLGGIKSHLLNIFFVVSQLIVFLYVDDHIVDGQTLVHKRVCILGLQSGKTQFRLLCYIDQLR